MVPLSKETQLIKSHKNTSQNCYVRLWPSKCVSLQYISSFYAWILYKTYNRQYILQCIYPFTLYDFSLKADVLCEWLAVKVPERSQSKVPVGSSLWLFTFLFMSCTKPASPQDWPHGSLTRLWFRTSAEFMCQCGIVVQMLAASSCLPSCCEWSGWRTVFYLITHKAKRAKLSNTNVQRLASILEETGLFSIDSHLLTGGCCQILKNGNICIKTWMDCNQSWFIINKVGLSKSQTHAWPYLCRCLPRAVFTGFN